MAEIDFYSRVETWKTAHGELIELLDSINKFHNQFYEQLKVLAESSDLTDADRAKVETLLNLFVKHISTQPT